MSMSSRMASRRWRFVVLAFLFVLPSAGTARAEISVSDAADDAGGGASAHWDALSVTSSKSNIANDAQALIVTLAPGDRASLSRATGLGLAPAAIQFTFDLSFSAIGSAKPITQVFRLGENFGSSNADESDAHTYARLMITAIADGFRLREAGGTATGVFHGTQAVTWALNNSGARLAYAAPNGTAESIGNDRMDVWVGREKVFDDVAVTSPEARVTDMKWFWGQGSGVARFNHFGIGALEPFDGAVGASVPEPVAALALPSAGADESIALERPTPNPFKQLMRFAYAVPAGRSPVDIAMFDIAGRQIRQLARGTQAAGQYEVRWNGRANDGSRVKRGVYFLRASIGSNQKITRIVYLPE